MQFAINRFASVKGYQSWTGNRLTKCDVVDIEIHVVRT